MAQRPAWTIKLCRDGRYCPTSGGTLTISEARAECKRLNVIVQKPEAAPAPEYVEYENPIFGIGALNLGDGAEVQTPWPKSGTICRRCGQAESDGAMFTTLGGSDICDDCV